MRTLAHLLIVMATLAAAIHFEACAGARMDGRIKPGHDG